MMNTMTLFNNDYDDDDDDDDAGVNKQQHSFLKSKLGLHIVTAISSFHLKSFSAV